MSVLDAARGRWACIGDVLAEDAGCAWSRLVGEV